MVLQGVDSYRVVEPLFEGVRIVLAHRGEAYSPAYLQGLSGAAFRVAGPCPCAPTCSAAMTSQDLIALLGYECRDLPIGAPGPAQADRWRQVLDQVRQELRAGRLVLVWNAFTSYEFDVVCGDDEAERQLLGRGSYAGTGDALARADEMRPLTGADVGMPAAILIGGRVRPFDSQAAELDALEEAVRHAHFARDRWLAEAGGIEKPWRFREGLACYEVWIDNYRLNPQRAPDGGDRYCLGVYRSTHRAAAAFLREIRPRNATAVEPLERAAVAFAREADVLDELRAQPGWNWEGKAQPGPAAAARAAALLEQARDQYAQGITQIEEALRALAPERADRARRVAQLRRQGGRVWIGGLEKLNWGKANTFAGALFQALRTTEHPYAYHEIMGLTGLAFRVRWCNDETRTQWCCSCPIGEMPDEDALVRRLMGVGFATAWIEPEGRDNEALRAKIVAAIDAGKPVLVYPPGLNLGIVYGYEEGGATLLVNDYLAAEYPLRLPAGELGPLFAYPGAWEQPPSLRVGFIEALKVAVANWHRERHDGGLKGREYWYGDAALAAWIRDLEAFDSMPADTRANLHRLDQWNLLSLVDARRSARVFLADYGRLIQGDVRQALTAAEELYQREVDALQPLAKERTGRPRSPDNWTADERRREIEALTTARQTEAEAIAAIERALQAAGAGGVGHTHARTPD